MDDMDLGVLRLSDEDLRGMCEDIINANVEKVGIVFVGVSACMCVCVCVFVLVLCVDLWVFTGRDDVCFLVLKRCSGVSDL